MRGAYVLGWLLVLALVFIDGNVAPAQSPPVRGRVYTDCEWYYVAVGDEIVIMECCIVEDYVSQTSYEECHVFGEPWQ